MTDVVLGSTDYKEFIFITDPAQSDGSGKTGLTHTDITVGYSRSLVGGGVTFADVTSSLNALAALSSDHNDWGWKEVSSALFPGLYRLDVADAVFVAGATKAVLGVMITGSAAAPAPIKYNLVTGDLNSISSRLPPALSGDNLMQVNVEKILNADPESSSDIKDAIFLGDIETSFPFVNIMKALASLIGGKNSGVGTGTITFRSINDSRNCVVVTIVGGNRAEVEFNFVD